MTLRTLEAEHLHTIMVIGGGLVLLGLFALAARMFALDMGTATRVFIGLWLVASLVNMWIGVARAGYSVAAEAPILLVVFGVPAVIALFVGWKLS
jgi:hypothetical protein